MTAACNWLHSLFYVFSFFDKFPPVVAQHSWKAFLRTHGRRSLSDQQARPVLSETPGWGAKSCRTTAESRRSQPIHLSYAYLPADSSCFELCLRFFFFLGHLRRSDWGLMYKCPKRKVVSSDKCLALQFNEALKPTFTHKTTIVSCTFKTSPVMFCLSSFGTLDVGCKIWWVGGGFFAFGRVKPADIFSGNNIRCAVSKGHF